MILVHYQGWKPRWDVWLSFSDDVAYLCTKTRPWRSFKVGDIVDANLRSRDDRTAWTEGRIIKVEGSESVLDASSNESDRKIAAETNTLRAYINLLIYQEKIMNGLMQIVKSFVSQEHT